MIASLRGTVIAKDLTGAVIECAGVGYRVEATPKTLGALTVGEEAFVVTAMIVKEDSMTLIGFTEPDERALFSIVQTAKGVGVKTALSALSVFSPAELANAIALGDIKQLTSIPGIGKRGAERLIVELKDKVGLYTSGGSRTTPGGTVAGVLSVSTPGAEEVIEALVGLSFSEEKASAAVADVYAATPDLPVAAALKQALALLARR